jgi:hypothetical protein
MARTAFPRRIAQYKIGQPAHPLIRIPEVMPKRRTVILVVVAALLMVILLSALPFIRIHRLDTAYRSIQRGATSNEVVRTMGRRGVWRTNAFGAFWDDYPLTSAESARARIAVRYHVDTFFLPVTFEFTFDETGKVVGKHRYD